ncbi:MAG: hypothetical protein IT302_15270 [Dehalococcoidia bacterium]|nr:hypothetical protein [Dehalococcoidia bacterium]
MTPGPGSEAPRVVEAGLRSFTCAYERYVEQPFQLGQVVAVREGPVTILGCIADTASGPEDPGRPLQAQGGALTAAEVFAENPHIRPLLRTRLTIAACGYISGEGALALLPPSPPPLLARVEPATDAEVVHATADGAFLALLTASPLCDDAVIAAAVRAAANAHGAEARDFTVRAGKELARLLKAEPARLSSILRGVTA